MDGSDNTLTAQTPDPSPSPRTNQLLQLAQDVADGRAAASDLASTLNETTQDLEAAQAGFLEKLPPEHRQHLGQEVEAVLSAFQAYRTATSRLQQYASSPCAELLDSARHELLSATAHLLSAVAIYEERELVASGPTANAYLNLIARFANLMRRGDVSKADYLKFVAQVESSVDEFPATTHEAADTAKGLHYAAMEELKKFAETYDIRGLERALTQLQQAAALFNEVLLSHSFDRLTEGPTAVPRFNYVFNMLTACAQGAVPASALQQEVAGFEQALAEFGAEVAQLRASSPHLAEHAQRAASALSRLQEFAARLHSCDSQESASRLLGDQAAYLEAADDIAAAQQAVAKSARQASKIHCPRCQHVNPPTASNCAVCNGPLPQVSAPHVETPQSAEQMPLTEELYGLLMAVNKIAANEISVQDFLRVTATIEQMVSDNEQQVYEKAAASSEMLEYGDLKEEERDQFMAVLRRGQQVVASSSNLIRDGLQRLQRFPQERNQRELEVGVRNVWEGFQRLYALHLQVEAAGGSSAA